MGPPWGWSRWGPRARCGWVTATLGCQSLANAGQQLEGQAIVAPLCGGRFTLMAFWVSKDAANKAAPRGPGRRVSVGPRIRWCVSSYPAEAAPETAGGAGSPALSVGWPKEDFIVLPLRGLLVQRPEDGDLAGLAARVPRIAQALNHILAAAGIYLALQDEIATVGIAGTGRQTFRSIKKELGLGQHGPEGFRLYLADQLDVNSAMLGNGDLIASVAPSLRAVEGLPSAGVEETIARVAAHALGLRLGLTEAKDERRLMARGTVGQELDPSEVAVLRMHAGLVPGARSYREALTEGRDPTALSGISAVARATGEARPSGSAP